MSAADAERVQLPPSKLWNVADKTESASLGPHKSTLWSVAFSPDGAVLAVGTHNEGVRLWNVASKAEVFPAPGSDKPAAP